MFHTRWLSVALCSIEKSLSVQRLKVKRFKKRLVFRQVGVLRDGEVVCGNAYEAVECASLTVFIKSDNFHTFYSAGCWSREIFLLDIIHYLFMGVYKQLNICHFVWVYSMSLFGYRNVTFYPNLWVVWDCSE